MRKTIPEVVGFGLVIYGILILATVFGIRSLSPEKPKDLEYEYDKQSYELHR